MQARRSMLLLLWTLLAPMPVSADPLEPASTNGTSIGTASTGYLKGGERLEPKGEHHEALPAHWKRKLRWGTPELVTLVREAAAAVDAAVPGSRLRIGNLSKQGGGDLKVSVSHNSGRDADRAFFALDAAGAPALPHGYVTFGDDGVSTDHGGAYRFDLPRNWALVKALVTNESAGASVQFLFISEGLRALLLDHAAELGEELDVLDRAGEVLKQPTAALPHAEHLHLRVYCPVDDVLDGCLDYGPRWDWAPAIEAPLRARALAIAAVLADEEVLSRRLRAVAALRSLRARDAVAWLAAAAGPREPRRLRMKALEALRIIRDPAPAPVIAGFLPQEADAGVAAALLDTLAVLGDPRIWPAVAGLLGDRRIRAGLPVQEPRTPASKKRRWEGKRPGKETLGARAARTLGHLRAVDASPALIDALASKARSERHRAAEALRTIANAAPETIDWRRPRRHVAVNAREVLRRVSGLRPWRPGDPFIGERWWKRWWRRHSKAKVNRAAQAEVGLKAAWKDKGKAKRVQ
jgi:penicillin-insensitive murein endopeptidase